MTTALNLVCFVLGAGIFSFKIRAAIRTPDLPRIAFCAYVGLSALSFLVLLPDVYAVIDSAVGILNSSGMVSGVSVLGLLAAQQILLTHWTFPPAQARRRIRNRLLLFGALITAYLATFFLRPPHEQRFEDFYVYYTRHPLQAPYLMIYIAGNVIGQLGVVRHCLRYARITPRPWIRRGMLVTVVGASLILVYCAIRISDIVGGQFGQGLRSVEPVAWLCGDIGSALALIGWVLPTLADRLSDLAGKVHAYRVHGRLYPLWSALRAAVPEVALAPPESRLHDRLRLRNIDFWLHRRVIEIQDALRALRPEIDPSGGSAASSSRSGPGMAALSDAIARAGQRRRDAEAGADRDPDGEVRWLCEVAREFAAIRPR